MADKYQKMRILETYAKIYHILNYPELLEKGDIVVKEWLFELTFDSTLPLEFREKIAELLKCISMYGFSSSCVSSGLFELAKVVAEKISN